MKRNHRSAVAWLGRAFAAAVLLGIAAGLLVEGLLFAGSFFTQDRSRVSAVPERSHIVLCAGDSHTYGAGVEPEESYPGRLRSVLEQTEPGRFDVLNLGVPGLNTSQVRARVPDWIARYSPETLVLWVGVNNAWNRAERASTSPALLERIDRLALRSRLYRLVRVWRHDLGLERQRGVATASPTWSLKGEKDFALGSHQSHVWQVQRDGVIERIASEPGDEPADVTATSEADFQAISETAKAHGIELIFITYPINTTEMRAANLAMWRVADRGGHALVQSWKSVHRVPPTAREWLWALHPGAALYREIAVDVAQAVRDPAAHRPPYSAEDFEAGFRELDRILLGLLMGVSRATPPVTAAERKFMREAFGRPLMLRTTPLELDEFAALIEAKRDIPFFRDFLADTGPESAELLRIFARSDGQISPREEEFIHAVVELLGR